VFEDFAGMDDLNIDELVSDGAAVAEAVGRRIDTPAGGLFYDPAYVSLDLESYQSRALSDLDLYHLRVNLERCVRAETRVATFTVDLAWHPESFTLRVTIAGVTVSGAAFELVETVDSEGVKLAVAA
jgi:hypothetical protein